MADWNATGRESTSHEGLRNGPQMNRGVAKVRLTIGRSALS
jgi:hypothetical protein